MRVEKQTLVDGDKIQIGSNTVLRFAFTDGLDEVVFNAVHSINSESPALIATSGETRSSSSERTEPLAVAVLAADDSVLALGDLTFMIEPFNAVSNNDRLIASMADYLSGVERQYELADFPFFFSSS